MQEPVEQARRAADAVDPGVRGRGDVGQVLAGEIGQLHAPEVGPDLLDRVEVRRVRRQPLDNQSAPLGPQPGLDAGPVVRRQAV
jgi:hypothetical protein